MVIFGFFILTLVIPVATFIFFILPSTKENFYIMYINNDLIGRILVSAFHAIHVTNKIAVLNFITVIMFANAFVTKTWIKILM